ncbi:hypothetical protein TWF191_008941 [Orbilia oligospora]|uniref:NADP-dependent oxidoreductase domain-containing protein n=1 Tax=Orbilia oligospora TaxID=2813651 RepID=A0A7C8UIG5_ORBOL|nr:hypothetical protein TWF191_008941 [Orbilia oligospora]
MSSKEVQKAFTANTCLTLSNGQKIPQIQLGVWESYDEECYNAVKWALEAGYRGIDSAEWYENEAICGRAINEYLTATSTPRSSIFFTTKLRNNVSYSETRSAIKRSLKECNLGYIDLYLIHAPYGGPMIREEIYRAVVDAVKDGEVKGWGAYTPLAKSGRFENEVLKEVAGRIVGNLKGSEGWGLEDEDMAKLRGLDEHLVTEWDPTDCP